jgi:hypothetical protein
MKNRIYHLTGILLIIFIFTPLFGNQETKDNSAVLKLEKILNDSGTEAAWVFFNQLILQQDAAKLFAEREFLVLGYKYLETDKSLFALEIFKMAAKLFPESRMLNYSLARAYRANGNPAKELETINNGLQLQNRDLLKKFLAKNNESLPKTVEEVIERHLKALGGKDKLLKIKTKTITLRSLNSINKEPFIKRYYKYPCYMRQDLLMSSTSIVTNGKVVWKVTGEKWEKKPGHQAVHMPDIYDDFIDYSRRGITYHYVGIEAIDREILYRLEKRYKDGERRDFYFSAETGLLVLARRIFGAGKDIKRYFDYREVQGILIPHMFVVTSQAGLGGAHGGIINEIKFNESLDDSLFINPSKE